MILICLGGGLQCLLGLNLPIGTIEVDSTALEKRPGEPNTFMSVDRERVLF